MTMPQLDRISLCPGCAEPFEETDRYCGVCGTDRYAAGRPTAGPAEADDAPTVVL
ncbi:serine/threonine-protein phosphatase, partial [Streptomyces durbertensis]|nr:serine/threonine-protein phosphatase [Streptomyces durbertensis]